MSNFRLDGKTAIITGGAGGLGVARSKTYAEAGANVVVASRNVDNCRKVVAETEEAGGKGLAVAVDITDEEQVNRMVEETVDTYGRLDIIVNNAGGGGE